MAGKVQISHQQFATPLTDIQSEIKEILTAAGLQDYILNLATEREYDDSCALVVLRAETNWCKAICRVVVFADRVARWHRFSPFNFNTGVVTEVESYDTVERLVSLVRERVFARRALSWLQGSPDVMSDDYLSHD